MNIKTKKSVLWGIGAGGALLSVYFLILVWANSFSHAVERFSQLWYWILALVAGFSIQAGLYSYVRLEVQEKKMKAMANKELAASAGVSTGSMVACCAHHLVDVLPILGLSAVFLFLADYQIFFILFGILSNVVGIIFMLEIIQKHALFTEGGILNQISQFNLKGLKRWAVVGSILVLLTTFLSIRAGHIQDSFVDSGSLATNLEVLSGTDTLSLPSRINNEGDLSVEIKPLNVSFNDKEPLRFEVSFNTHQGSLDFDLTKKSFLVNDQKNQYLPLEWQGARGGHHLTGILIFPPLEKETEQLKLIITDVYGIKEREFLWNLE